MTRNPRQMGPHLAFTLVFFILIPLHLVKENADEVRVLDPTLVVGLAWTGLLALAALGLVDLLLGRSRLRSRYRTVVEALTLFVALTGFVLPLTGPGGLTDPTELPIDLLNLLVAGYLAALLVYLAHRGRRSLIRFGFALFLGANASLTAWALVPRISTTPIGLHGLSELSRGPNLLVLSLDGVSGTAVTHLLGESPSLAQAFSGFTLYANVASSSPATSASTLASLVGNQDFKEAADSEAELWAWARDRLLTNRLLESGYRVSTYGIYNREFRDETRQSELGYWTPVQPVDLLNLSIARSVTRLFIVRGHTRRRLDGLLSRLPGGGPAPHPLTNRISRTHAPAWKKPLTASILDFRAWLDGLEVRTSQPVAQFSHFTFTHFPVEFERDCGYRGDDARWYTAAQDWDGVLAETECVLRLLGEVVRQLTELGVLKHSLVVFKSDHGKPSTYYPAGHAGAVQIHGHELWGVGRYEPFLMIRPRGAATDELRLDARPFLLDDLARTLCLAEGLALCSDYPGFDILNNGVAPSHDDTVILFVVANRKSDFRFDTHEAVALPRRDGVLRGLVDWAQQEAPADGGQEP